MGLSCSPCQDYNAGLNTAGNRQKRTGTRWCRLTATPDRTLNVVSGIHHRFHRRRTTVGAQELRVIKGLLSPVVITQRHTLNYLSTPVTGVRGWLYHEASGQTRRARLPAPIINIRLAWAPPAAC